MPEMKTSFALSSRASMMKNARRRKARGRDRKSTRLNSSHGYISYAVFCLKKKKKNKISSKRLCSNYEHLCILSAADQRYEQRTLQLFDVPGLSMVHNVDHAERWSR